MKQIATEENVKKAYKQLKDAGSEITVGSIRKILGGGSNGTILQILHTIEEENAETVICSRDPDEDRIIKEDAIPLVAELYRKCKKRAEELAKAQYRDLAAADEEISNKIQRLDEIEEQAKCRIDAAEAKMQIAITNAETANVKIKALEQTLKGKKNEIAELKQQIKKMQQIQQQQNLTNNLLKEVLSQLQR